MRVLKLLGYDALERQRLAGLLKEARWETGQLEDLKAPRPDDEVWVVSPEAARDYRDAVRAIGGASRRHGVPKAVIWVAAGKEPLPADDDGEGFAAEIREDREEDRLYMASIARRPWLLDWEERVASVPEPWFAALADSPRDLKADTLPFAPQEKREIAEDPEILQWVRERLGKRAEAFWAFACPEAEEIADWLESEERDLRLEERIRRCALARDMARRQAALWEGAGLLPSSRAAEKMAAVGAGPEDGRSPVPPSAWSAFIGSWEAGSQTVAGIAARLAESLADRGIPRPAYRGNDASDEGAMTLDEIAASLDRGEPVTLSEPGRWLHLSVKGGEVLVRSGESPAKRFRDFKVEFRAGEAPVVSVAAEAGVARLTPGHFRAAREGRADRWAVVR